MLENPYFAAPSSLPEDPGAYRGEGRIEEAEDGRSVSIWWESTLEEAVAVQLRLQDKLGITKQLGRLRIVFLVLGLIGVTLMPFAYWARNREAAFAFIAGGIALIFMFFLLPIFNKRNIRKIVTKMRGTAGTMDIRATVEPLGVHVGWADLEMIFYWRGVSEVEVSEHGVTILRQTDGLIHVPIRLFPDAATFERFRNLVQKYSEASKGGVRSS